MSAFSPQAAKELARELRLSALAMVNHARSSHIGGCFSMADMLAVLYGFVLRVDPKNPRWQQRDRYVQSKGHAAAILYATLAQRGFFPTEWLARYCDNGAMLGGHVSSHQAPGVELSTGALGHGLAVGCGMALAAQRTGQSWNTYVMHSDGELDEGSVWEAALFASHHQLSNLTALVDYNKIQSFGRIDEVLRLDPLADKWKAFGWETLEIDGHDHNAIYQALTATRSDKPRCIIAHTVKGKGVSFMENDLLWHYRPPDKEQYAQAVAELERA